MASVGELSAHITLDGLEEISSQLSQVGQSMNQTGSHISAMGNSFSNSSHGINGLNSSMFHTSTTIEGMEDQISNITNKIENFKQATSNADSATSQAYTETFHRLKALRSEYSLLVSATRQYGSETAKKMVEAMKPMHALELKAKEIQKQWINMGLDTDQFNGDTDAMMSSIEELGKKQKAVQDDMMKADKMGRISIMQQAGTMMNLSTQASKVSEAFRTQGSVFERMSNPALRVADGLNRMANRGNAAVLALKQLGPNANMKQLTDRIGMINQGIMRANSVALTGGILSALVYGSLAKGAMKTDKEFASMVETLKEVWSGALQPMVQAFADVGKAILPMLISLGKMVNSFNKAHPVLAKMIQGFLMLIPALILILSPLAVGIGMFAGMQAMFSALSVMIMPLITGLAAISAPVLIASAVIVGLIAVGVLLYKNWDKITKYCSIAWNWMKEQAVNIFNGIANFFREWGIVILGVLTGGIGILVIMIVTHWDQIKSVTATAWNAIVNVIVSVWTGIASFFSSVWAGIATIFNLAVKGIVAYYTTAFSILVTVAQAIWNGIVTVIKVAWEVIKTIILVAVAILGTVLNPLFTLMKMGWNGLVTVVQTVWNLIQSAVQKGITFIVNAWNVYKAGVMAVWKYVYTNAVAPVVSKIKIVVKTLVAVVVTIMASIKSAFSSAWNVVSNIVKVAISRVKATVQTLVGIVSAISSKVKSLFSTAWNAVASIVKSVIARIKSTVQTIVNIVTTVSNKVKSLFQSAWNAVASVVNSVVNRVKSIISSIINVVTSVGNKIRNGFSSAWNAVSSKVSSVINSIKSKISSIWGTASNIAGKIRSAFSNLFSGIKVPHFSISNASLNPKDWITKGMPKLNIAWHKNGGILDSSTLIGAGEAGAEAIVPLSSQRRMKPFAHAVASMMPDGNKSGGNTSIHVAQMIIREEADIQKVAQELNKLQDRKVRASGKISFA
ncbi:hypothetical protein [Bacillus sp. NPDC077027]|uniref:hypothetical protein n=1 Tax=Bacillus sp. NPDC077027 TaxID=3390548 RepID=UPI003D072EE3